MLQRTIWTARKTNRRSLEVYSDDRCQFSVVKFRSDSVQVCDLGSSKKGRSLKQKIQSRWGGGDVKGERRRCCTLSAPWVRAFLGCFSVCLCQMSQLSLSSDIPIAKLQNYCHKGRTLSFVQCEGSASRCTTEHFSLNWCVCTVICYREKGWSRELGSEAYKNTYTSVIV